MIIRKFIGNKGRYERTIGGGKKIKETTFGYPII
jgi:hypothetical protein